jgi:hypothetical protein
MVDDGSISLVDYHFATSEFGLGMHKDYSLQVACDEFEAEVERPVQPRDKADLIGT